MHPPKHTHAYVVKPITPFSFGTIPTMLSDHTIYDRTNTITIK